MREQTNCQIIDTTRVEDLLASDEFVDRIIGAGEEIMMQLTTIEESLEEYKEATSIESEAFLTDTRLKQCKEMTRMIGDIFMDFDNYRSRREL